MKLISFLALFIISHASFSQRPSKLSDPLGYETITYLESIDSSNLSWQEKSELEFAKIKTYIINNPKNGYSTQLIRHCNYFDTTKINALYNLLDTSLQRQILGGIRSTRKRATLLPGHEFPDLVLADTINNSVRISDLKGNIVFIDIWASWCSPCRKQIPELIKLYEKYKAKGLIVIPISMDDNKQSWLKAIKHDSIPWKHYCDLTNYDNNTLYIDWGIDSIPYNFLIDKDGRLIDKGLSMKHLEKILSNL